MTSEEKPTGFLRRLRHDLPRLLVESLLIVLSILLGFGFNEWRSSRAKDVLAKTAVERFRSEIAYNRQSVADRVDYHRSVSTKVKDELAREISTEEPLLALFSRIAPRGILPPDLRDTAWQSAVASRALEEIDYDLIFVMATVYRAQEAGVTSTWPHMVQETLRPESFDPQRRLWLLSYMGMAFEELASQEEALLSVYDFALAVLDGEKEAATARETLLRSNAAAGEKERDSQE